MRTDVLTAVVILVLGVAAGVVANTTWYGMDWVRQPAPPPPAAGPTSGPEAPPGGARARPGFVLIDEVLRDLAAGTAFFVDAREMHDFEEGHLRGAIPLPSSAIYDTIDNLYAQGVSTTDKIIIYCGGGDCEASHNVADALRADFGFSRVLIYEKGWQEIESSGRFGPYIESGGGP